jgi:imidazolonepropionase-like amidohydrolase
MNTNITMGSIRASKPKQTRRSRRRISLSFPFIAALLLVVFVQFSLLPSLFKEPSPSSLRLLEYQRNLLKAGLRRCAEFQTLPVQYEFPVSSARTNPRWNPTNGQAESILLRNATLFDGEAWLAGPIDILFSKGIIRSISSFPLDISGIEDVKVVDLAGKYVTPGLIDMHSHHLVGSWPASVSADDSNEVNPATGPLTPFVRSLDGMKPYDLATKIIASGGITTSLIIPGSANIMGGEGFVVKNLEKSGEHSEWIIEDMLLEYGLPQASRRRYMKMACGENPSRVYDHTRMGNAWILRKHLSRAKELMQQQDEWCLTAAAALDSSDDAAVASVMHRKLGDKYGLPEELELDSSVAMLRRQININIHCYEPEDFEDMLRHSHEFGFKINAFHHAISAWKVPQLIKELGENITIATFSEFALYKQEAYEASLWAGKILAEHGIPVAYKSDHGEEETNAKFLMFQAATAHAFHLPEALALQSVTSVPAKSLEIHHRVGYARLGYDADIVVWNSHPLRVGATPLQVYIDGKATLDPEKVTETLAKWNPEPQSEKPIMRATPKPEFVGNAQQLFDGQVGHDIIITGIKKSFLDVAVPDGSAINGNDLSMVLTEGKLTCFGPRQTCVTSNNRGTVIKLENGHVLPGLTALSSHLGLAEIDTLEEAADGEVSDKVDILDPENVVYAKYGMHLDGKAFKRARIGGVTRAVTVPMRESGLLSGVSVGIKTSGKKTILDGGIFQDDVALHFVVGQEDKGKCPLICCFIKRSC